MALLSVLCSNDSQIYSVSFLVELSKKNIYKEDILKEPEEKVEPRVFL